MIWGKLLKIFFQCLDSSGIKEEIIKKINPLKPFDMESRIAIPKKAFVSEEENYCDEEISFTQQDRIGNINWCKCGCDRKPMETFAESCCCRDTNKIQRYSTM